jgi:hypothetical protein
MAGIAKFVGLYYYWKYLQVILLAGIEKKIKI